MPMARRIILNGRVQGLGVRPAIARLAMRHHLNGRVRNRRDGVEVEIQGDESELSRFDEELLGALPMECVVQRRVSQEIARIEEPGFHIDSGETTGALRTAVPADVAMCSDCRHEVSDPANRRFGYAFMTCAACGPRFSITRAMPFERESTTMDAFSPCPQCECEYTNPLDRRFHAQTMACPICGPRVWAVDRQGRAMGFDRAAMDVAVAALLKGEIVALRGIGGYQLLCDATSSSAVARLRLRKRRASKPLAVMVESLEAARLITDVSAIEARWLSARENPIVLVAARSDSGLAPEIHPGLREVGVLLPSSSLHWWIAREFGRPFVATSGNREGEPLAVEVSEAELQLSAIADIWLHHDRPIANPVDDSVMRVIVNRPVMLRVARGFAPWVLPEWPRGPRLRRPLVAVGGHLKNSIAIDNGEQAALGPHIGDLDNERTRQRFATQISQLTRLFGAESYDVVHDAHPGYFTTEWASQQCRTAIAVQHHHAHVAATSWENGWLDCEILGFAWDGTGYGEDGSIWGGETLRSRGASWDRVGSCRPFPLFGGEVAVRQPWRVAVALLKEAVGQTAAREFASSVVAPTDADRMLAVADSIRFSPVTTSIGRLFDGVAALVLRVTHIDFEGQAAMLLEQACDHGDSSTYSLPSGLELDWRPMVREILHDLREELPRGIIASKFHCTLAQFVHRAAQSFPNLPVVLAGGVFQNRVLVESIVQKFGSASNRLGLPAMIPPNDGGLAAGQLAVACMRIRSLNGVGSCV